MKINNIFKVLEKKPDEYFRLIHNDGVYHLAVTEQPTHNAVWDMAVSPEENVFFSVCGESFDPLYARLYEFNPRTNELKHHLNLEEKIFFEDESLHMSKFHTALSFIGNEIGAATKNVIGIAAGMLDGLNLSTLKGALMSRGTREIANLIKAMGGNELSAYGLCHLGDYEATVFSKHSHNRAFGEAFIKGESFLKLAEGYFTVVALENYSKEYNVDLPICHAVFNILYNNVDAKTTLNELFKRSFKAEF